MKLVRFFWWEHLCHQGCQRLKFVTVKDWRLSQAHSLLNDYRSLERWLVARRSLECRWLVVDGMTEWFVLSPRLFHVSSYHFQQMAGEHPFIVKAYEYWQSRRNLYIGECLAFSLATETCCSGARKFQQQGVWLEHQIGLLWMEVLFSACGAKSANIMVWSLTVHSVVQGFLEICNLRWKHLFTQTYF